MSLDYGSRIAEIDEYSIELRKLIPDTVRGLDRFHALLNESGQRAPGGNRAYKVQQGATLGKWARQDSNLQPDRYERPALTIELQAPCSAARRG